MTSECKCNIPLGLRHHVIVEIPVFSLVRKTSSRPRSHFVPFLCSRCLCSPPSPDVLPRKKSLLRHRLASQSHQSSKKMCPSTRNGSGPMVGNVDAEIRPKVDGFLLTRLYSEGSYVNKGQPMFQLDQRQAQAAVEQATGNLERARAL